METLLLVLVILGIGALLGVSMLIPNTTQHSSVFYKKNENGSKSFSRGFFIGMLFPIIIFIVLGGFGYALCNKGYCTIGNIIPLLSGLGVLWITLIAIRLITPFFIGRVAVEKGGNYTIPDKKALKAKNLTKYISYTLVLSLLLVSLLLIDAEKMTEAIRNFCWGFGRDWKFLDTNYFKNIVAWFFYMLNISALIGVISTLRMVAGETERRGNEAFQEQKLRDFESKIK